MHQAPLSQRAGEVEREDDAQRSQQPERVPVGDRVAQTLVGDVGGRAPHIGRHAADQPGQAHDRSAEGQAADQPAHVERTRADRAEQDQHEQIQPRSIELDQRPARRVRPQRRGERQGRVQAHRGDRNERGAR